MARHTPIEFTKTYASPATAEKAVQRLLGKDHAKQASALRYAILPVVCADGVRYGVLFIGQSAIENQIHFHFNVAC